MRADWRFVPLGKVCKLYNGRAYSKQELLSEGPTPVLRVGNFFTNPNWYYSDLELEPEKYCDNGDLLYAWSASFGPRIWDGGKVIYHYHIWKVEPNEAVLEKRYLFYLLDWDKEQIKASQGAGTTMMHVTKGSMEARIIPLPPLEEQRRIVAALDEAFAAIAAATANAEKNLANARELFEQASSKLLSEGDNDWREYALEDVCSISSKLVDPRQEEFIDLPHLGAGNMESRSDVLSNVLTAREEGLISGKFLFNPSMVLYSKIRPYLMKACRPEFAGLCSADVYPLSPRDGKLDRNFLFHILLSRDFTAYAEGGSARSGMPKVNRSHLFAYRVKLPSIEEQRELAVRIDGLSEGCRDLADRLENKLKQLEVLKQSLLHLAFSGELTATMKETIAA